MPFCPNCHFEYRKEVKTCPECKVDLVDHLNSENELEDVEFTEVYMVSNRMEADVISGLMKENEIPVLIRDLRVFPVLPDFGRRARLRVAVASDKAQEAMKLLKEAKEDGVLDEQGRFL